MPVNLTRFYLPAPGVPPFRVEAQNIFLDASYFKEWPTIPGKPFPKLGEWKRRKWGSQTRRSSAHGHEAVSFFMEKGENASEHFLSPHGDGSCSLISEHGISGHAGTGRYRTFRPGCVWFPLELTADTRRIYNDFETTLYEADGTKVKSDKQRTAVWFRGPFNLHKADPYLRAYESLLPDNRYEGRARVTAATEDMLHHLTRLNDTYDPTHLRPRPIRIIIRKECWGGPLYETGEAIMDIPPEDWELHSDHTEVYIDARCGKEGLGRVAWLKYGAPGKGQRHELQRILVGDRVVWLPKEAA